MAVVIDLHRFPHLRRARRSHHYCRHPSFPTLRCSNKFKRRFLNGCRTVKTQLTFAPTCSTTSTTSRRTPKHTCARPSNISKASANIFNRPCHRSVSSAITVLTGNPQATKRHQRQRKRCLRQPNRRRHRLLRRKRLRWNSRKETKSPRD